MHDVFISYSSRENEAAEAVRNILEKNQIPCWMAPRDIPSGSNYAKEIPVAIRGCQVFVLMFSENAQSSPWVLRELDTAVNCGKVIIPFMLENCQLSDEFNFLLTGAQRHAAYRKKAEAMESLVTRIHAVTGKKPFPSKDPGECEEFDSGAQQEGEGNESAEPAREDTKCPNCGSNQVIRTDSTRKGVTTALLGGTAFLALGPLAGVAAGAAGHYLGNKSARFRCKVCGKDFARKKE